MILTIPGLTPGKTYSLQIRSKVNGNVSPWSASYVFESDPTGPLPATPENPTFVVSGDSFYAEWDSVEIDVDGNLAVIPRYEIEFSAGASLRYVSVAQQTADKIGYILSFEENRALFGTPQAAVGMRVRSVNSLGFKSDWTTIINATNPAPAAVSGLSLDSLIDSISIRWNASTESDVIEYRVQHSDSASGPWTTVYEGSNNSFVHPNVMWNDDSFYHVAALDKFESISPYSASGAIRPQSSFGGDTTPPANATSITATPGFDADRQVAYIDVAWTQSVDNDVANYLVRYSTDGTAWQYLNIAGDLTGVRIDNLSPGLSYYIGVRAKDFSGNDAAAWSNASPYPVTTTADTTAPSEPSAPTASVGVDRIQVTVAGTKAAGGAMESDVSHYQIHASTTSGFTPTSATQLGVIPVSPAMVATFHIPANSSSGTTQTWYVKIRAVDGTGNISPVSSQTSAAVDLIQTANIGDAQITNAKIASLEANKITAGTGIINDLTVKSEITVGAAGDSGAIKSHDYVTSSGASGFYLSDTGLIIKSGSIEASALNIAMGENIVRPEYASFEWSSYTGRLAPNSMLAGVNSGTAFNGNKYLATIWGTASADPVVYLGANSTDYNQSLIVGQKYIISAYARVTGAVATTVRMKIKDSTGAIVTLATVNPTTGSSSWTRFSGVYTATTDTSLLFFDSPTWTNVAGFDIDGIQIERVYGSVTTPSQWRPPGITQIDGGMIRTGTIQSTQEAVDIEGNAITGVPSWSINTAGSAQFGNVNVRGRIIMGDSNDPAVDPVTGEETTLTGLSAMQSYNYVTGFTGWAIKGNGVAEFRQLAADSIDGSAIATGTLAANKISSGEVTADILLSSTITAQESREFLVQAAGLNGNVAEIVTFDTSTIAIGDRIVVSLDSEDPFYNPIFDTPFGEYDIVTAFDSVSIFYTRVGANIAMQSIGGTVSAVGKKVTVDGSGVTLYESDGVTKSVILPTDSDQNAYFSGAISASELSVDNHFSLHGTNNLIGSGSILTLRSSMSPPPSPKAETIYENNGTWLNTSNDDYFQNIRSILVDGTQVVILYDFFGANWISYDLSNGAYVNNKPISTPSTTSDFTPMGITKMGSTYYVLLRSYATGIWYVYSSTSLTGSFTQRFIYDESAHSAFGVTAEQWKNISYLKEATIGNDGTNLFIVRPNRAGYPVVTSYNTSGTRLTINKCNFVANEHMRNIHVGTFDYSGTQWVISTPTKNYVTSVGGLLASDKQWPAPGGVTQVGVSWDVGSNRFCTFAKNNYKHYWFTDVAHQTSNSEKWMVYQTWRDQSDNTFNVTNKTADGNFATLTISGSFSGLSVGDEIRITGVDAAFNGLQIVTNITSNTVQFATTTIMAATASSGTVGTDKHETLKSPGQSINVVRRSRVKITSSVQLPYGAGANDIHAAGFYISINGGPQFNQGDLIDGNAEIILDHQPVAVTGSTYFPFPDGIPGQISSDDGTKIVLKGDGSWNLGNISGAANGATNLVRFVARNTNSGQPTAGSNAQTNLCTVTIPYPVNGRTYQVIAQATVQTNTAGAYTRLDVKHAFGASTGGTTIASAYQDHRVINRSENGNAIFAEFVYTGNTGSANYNVVLVMFGGGGTSTSRGDLTPARLTVHEIC